MNHLNFINSFICPHCQTQVNTNSSSTLDSVTDFRCKCNHSSLTHYAHTNTSQLYLNLTWSLQIQIFADPYKAILQVVHYPPPHEVFDPKAAIHLVLDYIPYDLSWHNIDALNNQIETLITFQ